MNQIYSELSYYHPFSIVIKLIDLALLITSILVIYEIINHFLLIRFIKRMIKDSIKNNYSTFLIDRKIPRLFIFFLNGLKEITNMIKIGDTNYSNRISILKDEIKNNLFRKSLRFIYIIIIGLICEVSLILKVFAYIFKLILINSFLLPIIQEVKDYLLFIVYSLFLIIIISFLLLLGKLKLSRSMLSFLNNFELQIISPHTEIRNDSEKIKDKTNNC